MKMNKIPAIIFSLILVAAYGTSAWDMAEKNSLCCFLTLTSGMLSFLPKNPHDFQSRTEEKKRDSRAMRSGYEASRVIRHRTVKDSIRIFGRTSQEHGNGSMMRFA